MKKILLTALIITLLFTACGHSESSSLQNSNDSIVPASSTTDIPEEEQQEEKEEVPLEEPTSTPSDEVSLESEKSEQRESFDIDIKKCISDLKAGLPLEPDYTFVNDYEILADGKNLTISIVVDDSTAPEKALDFADTVVRQLNLYANMQDANIELGNKDFYGGLYTEYSALVGVAPYSKMNNTDEWFVYDAIVGGKVMLKLQ